MTDWLRNKDLGPWDFVKQQNKWGYLNNPRWKSVPSALNIYDGHESDEPQIWTPPTSLRHQSSSKHLPCGHWHRPVQATPAPTALIGVVGAGCGLANALLYDGNLSSIGNIEWTSRTQYEVEQYTPGPLRIVRRNDLMSSFHYAATKEANYYTKAFVYTNSSYTGTNLWYRSYVMGLPCGQECCIRSDGLALAITNYGPYKLKKSTDYGATWGAEYNIDYLYNLVGSTIYNNIYTYVMNLEVDKVTGTIYLLCTYGHSSYTNTHWLLLKSTDGSTWDVVEDWEVASIYGEYSAIAVNDNRLCVVHDNGSGGLGNNKVLKYSDNSGVSWNSITLPFTNGFNYNPFIVPGVNNSAILAYYSLYVDTTHYERFVLRSVDGGANWTQVFKLRVTISGVPASHLKLKQLRNNSDVFLISSIGVTFPLPNAWWWDSELNQYSLDLSGTPYLCFWSSQDSGATWKLQVTPIEAAGVPVYGYFSDYLSLDVT